MKGAVELAKEFYVNELNDYRLYRELAKRVKSKELRKTLEHIANMEKGHSLFWRRFLQSRGEELPAERRRPFQSVLLWLGRFVNPIVLISLLELGESNAYMSYYSFMKSNGGELSEEELDKLKGIILDELSHESRFREEIERLGLSNVRDMVLGMNDGLVELLGVVAGLSAVYREDPVVVGASGVVVGMAGAISMGVGAFISVRSQRQVNEALARRERIISELKGVRSFKDGSVEESEIRSALFTGASYLAGVVFPVAPFFFVNNSLIALVLSFMLALAVLAFVGSFVALVSGIPVRKKVVEMILSASFAALASYAVGKLVSMIFGLDLK